MKKLTIIIAAACFASTAVAAPFSGGVLASRDIKGVITYKDNLVFTPTASNSSSAATQLTAQDWQKAYQKLAESNWTLVTQGIMTLYSSVSAVQNNHYNGATYSAQTPAVVASRNALNALVPALNTSLTSFGNGAFSDSKSVAYGQNYININGQWVHDGYGFNAVEPTYQNNYYGTTWTQSYFPYKN